MSSDIRGRGGEGDANFEGGALEPTDTNGFSRRSMIAGGAGVAMGLMALGPSGPTAANALTPPPNTSVFYPEDYGAVGNGVTNDTAAIQACIDAATTTTRGSATVQFGPKVYQVDSLPRTDRGGNAILALPWGGFGGIRLAGVWGATIIRTSVAGQAYSATHGCPSVIGGPTPEKVSGFSYRDIEIVDLRIQVGPAQTPAAPTIAGIDLVRHTRCKVSEVYVMATPAGPNGQEDFLDPSANWWAFGLRLPEALNFGHVRADHVDVYGFYVGIVCYTSHTHITMAIVKWCFLGVGLSPTRVNRQSMNDPHGSHFDHISTEWCTQHIAAWLDGQDPDNPTLKGAHYLPVNRPYFVTVNHWDIEDAPLGTGKWYLTFKHVADYYNQIVGRAYYLRVIGAEPNALPKPTLDKTGGANLSLTSLRGSY